jgi:hypothetical protein
MQHFRVLYTKQLRKKNKSYHDGYLVLLPHQQAKLLSEDGSCLTSARVPTSTVLEEGADGIDCFDGYLINVDCCAAASDIPGNSGNPSDAAKTLKGSLLSTHADFQQAAQALPPQANSVASFRRQGSRFHPPFRTGTNPSAPAGDGGWAAHTCPGRQAESALAHASAPVQAAAQGCKGKQLQCEPPFNKLAQLHSAPQILHNQRQRQTCRSGVL